MENPTINHFDTNRPSKSKKVGKIIGLTFLGILFAILFAFVFGIVVMWLWNWIMPTIFEGIPEITFWQAFGIILLSKILFSGFHPHHDHEKEHKTKRGFKDEFKDEFKKHFFESLDDEICKNKSFFLDMDSSKMRYYEQYWQEKGKADFEEYMKNIKQQKENNQE